MADNVEMVSDTPPIRRVGENLLLGENPYTQRIVPPGDLGLIRGVYAMALVLVIIGAQMFWAMALLACRRCELTDAKKRALEVMFNIGAIPLSVALYGLILFWLLRVRTYRYAMPLPWLDRLALWNHHSAAAGILVAYQLAVAAFFAIWFADDILLQRRLAAILVWILFIIPLLFVLTKFVLVAVARTVLGGPGDEPAPPPKVTALQVMGGTPWPLLLFYLAINVFALIWAFVRIDSGPHLYEGYVILALTLVGMGIVLCGVYVKGNTPEQKVAT